MTSSFKDQQKRQFIAQKLILITIFFSQKYLEFCNSLKLSIIQLLKA
jgi:hypothetical protein